MSPTPRTNPSDAAQLTGRQVSDAVELLRALLSTAGLDGSNLGLTGLTPAQQRRAEAAALVPGKPIRIKDLVRKTRAGLKESTDRTYGTYLEMLSKGWPASAPKKEKLFKGFGKRWAHEVLASELEDALRFVEARALLTAHWRGVAREAVGREVLKSDASGAKYNAVGAWRSMFKVAVKDRHLGKAFDPSQDVDKPRRPESKRRALEPSQLDELWELVDNTGNDPELDRLLCETIIIAGARREGLLNLELSGLDRQECTIRLDEKFDKVVDQPVPDWFVQRLYEFAVSRGAGRPGDKVFRQRARGKQPARAITSRRLDGLFQRLQAAYAWADKRQVTAHTLRHHAITAVERSSSKAVALRFARHVPTDTNDRYSKASDLEVATAVVRLYGGDHPWLHR
jgi:site-specific recombinase XerC